MSTAREAEQVISKIHDECDRELAEAIAERDKADKRVAAARKAKAEAPRLHVPRKHKPKAAAADPRQTELLDHEDPEPTWSDGSPRTDLLSGG